MSFRPLASSRAFLKEKLRRYRFEIRHVAVLFVVLLIFQILVSLVHKISLQDFLVKTQAWYQQDSAERLANLTTTSLELLLETSTPKQALSGYERRNVVQALNVVIGQQLLYQNVQELCLFVPCDTAIAAIDEGEILYAYFFENLRQLPVPQVTHLPALRMYEKLATEIRRNEQVHTVLEGKQIFHVFVPFIPRGEYSGVVYMKISPDFSPITTEVIANYDKVAIIFTGLIMLGLLAMYFLYSNTLRERDEAQARLFEAQKLRLAEQIDHQKELLFTKRIYHTHHKAEKVMGFIKEDLHALTENSVAAVKSRATRYANFIARVIYDMKWYDPPLHTIRNALFKTNVNEVLRFLVTNVFQRLSRHEETFAFKLDLDERMPEVAINEYVVWEVFEPIMQNSLDHAGVEMVEIAIRTAYDHEARRSRVMMADNGKGIPAALLQENENGIKRIFEEHVTTENENERHAGYGCYLAYEIATQRCGWKLDAQNLPGGGAQFTFIIPHD